MIFKNHECTYTLHCHQSRNKTEGNLGLFALRFSMLWVRYIARIG